MLSLWEKPQPECVIFFKMRALQTFYLAMLTSSLCYLVPLHPQFKGKTLPTVTLPPPACHGRAGMADSRKPEDPQWDPSGGSESSGNRDANGYSSSGYRSCQQSGTHVEAGSYSTRENGFNGELTGAHAVTAGEIALPRVCPDHRRCINVDVDFQSEE